MSALEPARSFDRVAEEYERARPDYPPALLDLLPLGAGAEVLDLGAGTGKLTRVLTERYRRVVAVEPLEGMRAILEAVVPEAETLAGGAESIPLPDASFDGVFAGQAFHWFANDTAVAEIARVLRPGGVLCLTWNQPAEPSPLPEPYRAYLRTLHAPSREAVQSGLSWAEVVGRGPFEPLRQGSVPHEQRQSHEEMLAFAQSVSWIAHRPDAERARIVRDLDALLPEGPFTIPLTAEVLWTVRTRATREREAEATSLARSHARVAAVYHRARVDHSREGLDLVIRATGLGRSAMVVDLAAGTGKLTKLLLERFDAVIAIEPEDAMRAYIGGDARPGTAEAIPLPDASVDGIFVADAFHWFDAAHALGELARVLRPGGWLVLIWNQWWLTDPPLPPAALALLDAPFRRFGRARDLATGGDWHDAIPHEAFEPEHTTSVEDETVLGSDDLVDLFLTTSSLAALSDDEREMLTTQLCALLRGDYRLPMRHELHWLRRR